MISIVNFSIELTAHRIEMEVTVEFVFTQLDVLMLASSTMYTR